MDRHEAIFGELIEASLASGNQIPALSFRVQHEDDLDVLDQFEQGPYLSRKNDIYSITLLGMRQVRARYPGIDSVVYRCEHIFDELRDHYRQKAGESLTWAEFLRLVDMPEHQVLQAVRLMDSLPIWMITPGAVVDQNSVIGAGEGILKFKNLDRALDQLEEWLTQPYEVGGVPLLDGIDDRRAMIVDYPDWYGGLPETIRQLLVEIRLGLQSKRQFFLPAMGLRSVIDLWLNDVVGNIGGFSEKLKKARESGHITPTQLEVLRNTLEVGHASTHRGFRPTMEDNRLVLQIVENLVNDHYILREKSKQLASRVPKRKPT